jgi:hypothetical protein
MADEITLKEEIVIEAPIEPIPEPVQVSEAQTAQIPVSEPLPTPTEIEAEPVVEPISTEIKPVETEIRSEPISESISEPEVKVEMKREEVKPEISEPIQTESKTAESISETKPEPEQETKSEVIPAVAVISKSKSLARELLIKARKMIQFRKRKKLDKVMTLFLKKQKITNDEVEKFLHVSDATATRYLNTLEKENKIKQNGKTGKSVFYSKI